jgi:NarL family two-component system response regulator LiaR
MEQKLWQNGQVMRGGKPVKEKSTIRVVIVDDHEMIRAGLRVFLEAFDDLELVGEASDGEAAVAICELQHPDVVLMDLVMPGMSGVSAIRTIIQTHPDIQVIALTGFNEQHLVHEALQTGAIGYMLKNVSIDELANAIRAAHNGQPTLTPEVFHGLVEAVTHPEPSQANPSLTPREVEVLRLIVAGLHNHEIAVHLTISQSTVKTHVSNILTKLGTSTRAEAAALAVQHNLVT